MKNKPIKPVMYMRVGNASQITLRNNESENERWKAVIKEVVNENLRIRRK